MIEVGSLAEALEQIRQGCTELNLSSACRGAALPRPRRSAARACTRAGGGACGAPAPSARRTRARRAHTARAPAPRAAGNSIYDQATLAAIESLLDANKARPPASVRHMSSPPPATPTRDLPRCLEPLPSMHRRHANAQFPVSLSCPSTLGFCSNPNHTPLPLPRCPSPEPNTLPLSLARMSRRGLCANRGFSSSRRRPRFSRCAKRSRSSPLRAVACSFCTRV